MLEKMTPNPKKDKILAEMEKLPESPVEHESVDITLDIPGKPENYARERTGNNHFYNPKGAIMRDCRMACLAMLTRKQYKAIKDIIKKNNDSYTVELDISYYYPIPKGDSIRTAALKAAGHILPTVKVDLDNYDKFLLDALHDVLYDDDKHVVSIHSRKLFALEPKTVVKAKVIRNTLKE